VAFLEQTLREHGANVPVLGVVMVKLIKGQPLASLKDGSASAIQWHLESVHEET
jgi:hypothetical protein